MPRDDPEQDWGRGDDEVLIMGTTPEENAALARRFLTDVIAGEDTDAVDAFVTEGIADHHLAFEDGKKRESDAALGWVVLAAADVEIEVEDVVATTDRVAVRATVSGTHRESLMDFAPTGTSFEIAYVWLCHIEDGQIAEIWSLPDGLGLLRQLDALQHVSNSEDTTRTTER